MEQFWKSLKKNTVFLLLPVFLGALLGYFIGKARFKPMYCSAALVRTSAFSIDADTQTRKATSRLMASSDLAATYQLLLKSRVTLEQIAGTANCGLNARQINGLLKVEALNAGSAGAVAEGVVENTGVLIISARSTDADVAALLANTAVQVLGHRVNEVIGTSLRLIDPAVASKTPEKQKPSLSIWIFIGAVLFGALGFVVLFVIDHQRVESKKYLEGMYQIPVLTAIPDLLRVSESDIAVQECPCDASNVLFKENERERLFEKEEIEFNADDQ